MSEIRQSKGMTLVEMMIAIGITVIVMAMSLSIFTSQFGSYNRGKNVKEVQQSGQEVIGVLKSDLMQAGWSVSPRMAFFFQDGGANGTDTIVLNDTSIISLANDPAARALVLAMNYPGGTTMGNSGTSSIPVPALDLNGDLADDFVSAASQYVISDGTLWTQKVAMINTIAGNTLQLASSLTGTMVAPAIFYSSVNGILNRSDRSTGGLLPMVENVVDLQVAYKDNNDAACVGNNQAACDAAPGCGWLNGGCTGYWYGKPNCAGQGSGSGGAGTGGFCTLSPFDSGLVTLIRVGVITRSSGVVDGSLQNLNYCRPALENRAAAVAGSATDCGFVYRTYSAVIQPRSNRSQ